MIETNAHDLDKIADALREASDKTLTNNVRASLRTVARPLGEEVIHEGSEKMPKRGGLAERVRSQGKAGLSTALVAKSTKVTLLLNNKGVQMRSLDAGLLRHKVFGQNVWVRQSVPEGAFTEAFKKRMEHARIAALHAAESTLNEVGRKV